MFPEGKPGGIPLLRRIRRQFLPRIQATMFGDWTEHLGEQIRDGFHVAQRSVSAAFRKAIILSQCLQLAVAGRNRIEKTLSQSQGAEARRANRRDTQPLPLRLEHFIQIVFKIERDERQVAPVFGKLTIDLARRFAIALQNFASVTVNARCFGGNVRVLIQQLAGRFAVRFPAAHPLRGKFDDKDRRGEARRFGVQENPVLLVHRPSFRTGLSGWLAGPKYFSSSRRNSGSSIGLVKNVTFRTGSASRSTLSLSSQTEENTKTGYRALHSAKKRRTAVAPS